MTEAKKSIFSEILHFTRKSTNTRNYIQKNRGCLKGINKIQNEMKTTLLVITCIVC